MKTSIKVLLTILLVLLGSFFLLRNPDKSLSELEAIYTDETSSWIEINGMEVHYKKEGSGTPIVLVHGTGASLHTWDGWAKALKHDFTVIRMDLPAYGLTGPEPRADYSIEMYTEFIDKLTSKLGLDSFAIAGNSLGGHIAWSYTVAHPNKVKSLLLIDASGYPSEGPSKALVFKLANNPLLRPFLKHFTPSTFIRKNLEEVYGDKSLITNDLVRRYHDLALRTGNRQAFIDRIQSPFTDNSELIKTIVCPTLVIWGLKDTWIDPNNAEKFKVDIPHARILYYDDLGHVPMEEDPSRTVKDALIFLKEP